MFVLLRDRAQGKTTLLVQWLLEGEPRSSYPGWSRVIVCASHQAVTSVTGTVKAATEEEWRTLSSAQDTDNLTVERRLRLRALADLRKAVWSLDDLRHNSAGIRMDAFDYAIDNLDILLPRLLQTYKPPERITMTAKEWT